MRLGDRAILLGALADAGTLGEIGPAVRGALARPTLKPLIELGPAAWAELRGAVRAALDAGRIPDAALLALTDAPALLPVRPPDFVDFYASRVHAETGGRILRPEGRALPAAWDHLPLGYHSRSGAVVPSGAPIRRPRGQVPGPDGVPRLAPTAALDFECELGLVCGPATVPGEPLDVDAAAERIFGVVLVNDWSARDVQRLESVPLGPFLGKSFATSMSSWIVPLDALAHARVAPPAREAEPPDYLRAREPWTLALELEVEIDGVVVSRPRTPEGLDWTPAQLLGHLTVNGAALGTGDLVATGTVSAPEPDARGCLLELTWAGRDPRAGGRTWLEDGEEVVLRGRAGPVALGEVRGRILPA